MTLQGRSSGTSLLLLPLAMLLASELIAQTPADGGAKPHPPSHCRPRRGLLHQPPVDSLPVDPGDPDARGARVQWIDQNVPGLGNDRRRHAQQRGTGRGQPLVAQAAGSRRLASPRRTKKPGIDRLNGYRIWRVDFQPAESDRDILDGYLGVYQNLKQGGRGVLGAVRDAGAAGMPSTGGAQAARAVEGRMVADAPKSHAAMPSSI
jgi:hypothetical protein